LQDEDLKHHRSIEGGTPHFALVGWLGKGYIKDRNEDVPIDVRLKLYQRIFQFCQAFQKEMFVEKAQRIDVFYGRGCNGVVSAIKYNFSTSFG
jgi:hypothetical protein